MDFNTEYANVKNELAGVYKPTTDFYTGQMNNLQAEYDPMRTAADQARVNSFRKIENAANSRGMFFSGQPISAQMDYNYGTYNPAMANIDLSQKNKKTSLEETLLKIGTQIDTQARSTAADRVTAWQKEQQRLAEEAESRRRWEIQQANERERIAISRASAYNSSTNANQNKYKVTAKKNGAGYAFTGPNGTPISMAEFVGGSGGDMNTALNLLQNGSSYDKYIYSKVANKGYDAGRLAYAIAGWDDKGYLGFGSTVGTYATGLPKAPTYKSPW
jgi:hypothetical protein